jgi:hypothetical protein
MTSPHATRLTLTLLLALLGADALTGCGGEERAAPTPPSAPVAEAPPVAPAAPSAPTLTVGTLPVPTSGQATLGVPAGLFRNGAAGHEQRAWPAKFGRGAEAAQLQFGVRDGQERATLAFYGRSLTPGRYEVLPGNDETVAANAGRDSHIFTFELRAGGHDVRSVSGSVTISAVDGQHIVGELEVRAQDRQRSQPEPDLIVARFDAAYDSYIDAWIQNESEVRAQLRARTKRGR